MSEIDTLIERWLYAHTDEAQDSASPDNELKISQQTDTEPYPTVSIPTRVNHLHGNQTVRIYVSDEEVISLFQYKAGHFLDLHQKHTAPVDLTDPRPLSRRLGGCCGHLKHQLQRVLIEHMPNVAAHVHSNTPYERLCLACIRQ